MRSVLAVAALVGLGVLSGVAALAGEARTTRVVDRRLVCSTSHAQAFQVYGIGVETLPDILVSWQRGGIAYDRNRCRATSIRIPLAPGRLPGPMFAERMSCPIPGRILVRARLTYTGTRVDRAELAVRLYKRRIPIAFARATPTGTRDEIGRERYDIRQWVSGRCY